MGETHAKSLACYLIFHFYRIKHVPPIAGFVRKVLVTMILGFIRDFWILGLWSLKLEWKGFSIRLSSATKRSPTLKIVSNDWRSQVSL